MLVRSYLMLPMGEPATVSEERYEKNAGEQAHRILREHQVHVNAAKREEIV
jgi:hypothetical protein